MIKVNEFGIWLYLIKDWATAKRITRDQLLGSLF